MAKAKQAAVAAETVADTTAAGSGQMAEGEQIIYLAPEKILADDNTRFSLKQSRLDSLKTSILEQGGIHTPIEVEPLDPPVKGADYRLTTGFYRLNAALALNREQGAGLQLPAIVRSHGGDSGSRLKRQLSENMDRENQSPMDRAIAIQKLIGAGVEKGEIRRIFSAAGGRKGNQVQPMSNAMLNILVRLLELPKAIQEKIHDGRVGLGAAYELGKVPPDKRQAVLDRAEKERIAELEAEEKDENKYLESERKLAQAEVDHRTAEEQVKTAKQEAVSAAEIVEQKIAAQAKLKKEILVSDKPAGPAEVEALKAAEADVKGAAKVEKEAKNKLAKALAATKTAEEKAADHKARLEQARKLGKGKAGSGKGKGVGAGDVKKAAKAEGGEGRVALNVSEIRVMLKDMRADGVPAKVQHIGKAFQDALDSMLTTKELIHALAVITGEERTQAPAPQQAPAPATAPAQARTMPAAPAVRQGPVAKKK